MDFECAVSWNQQHPVGTRVSIRRVDGSQLLAKTSGPAQQWGSFAIVPLEGEVGMWTTRALSPVNPEAQVEAPESTGVPAAASSGG